mmetsp:Transcript_34132/g.68907  ORF Transcript_34132/g.68907 Transcript_34132/m.68907 type:complete len:229 (+) Transcript_34132:477-1163(+)
MAPGDRDVRDAHVALVAAAQLEHLLREGEDVQAPGGVLLGVAHHVLEHDEGRLRPRHLHQRGALLARVEVGRVHCLAQLAGQRPVEVGAPRRVREVQAPADPVAQAPEVHVLDGALALARGDEGVVLAGPLEQADAAERGLELAVGGRVCAAGRPRVVEPELRLGARVCRCGELPHPELEAAELHDIALGQTVAGGWEVAHHQPELLRAAGWGRLIHPESSVALDKPK